jgi:hypothetical protein
MPARSIAMAKKLAITWIVLRWLRWGKTRPLLQSFGNARNREAALARYREKCAFLAPTWKETGRNVSRRLRPGRRLSSKIRRPRSTRPVTWRVSTRPTGPSQLSPTQSTWDICAPPPFRAIRGSHLCYPALVTRNLCTRPNNAAAKLMPHSLQRVGSK